MNNITSAKTWTSSVYIIHRLDPVEEGVDGADSKGNVGNGQRAAYVKQESCEFIRGTGVPVGNLGMVVDSDSINNTFYIDEATHSIWTPLTVVGSNITAWKNVSKNFQLNVKGFRVNDNGSDTNYGQLLFDQVFTTGSSGAVVYDRYNDLSGLRIGRIICDKSESVVTNQIRIADADLMANNIIKKEADNQNSGLAVNNYNGSNVQQPKFFFFDVSRNLWNCYDANGLLGINVSKLFINNVPFDPSITSLEEIIITNQSQFDTYFNTDVDGGVTTFSSATPFHYIYIYPGFYNLRNRIIITKENFTVKASNGAVIKILLSAQANPTRAEYLWSGFDQALEADSFSFGYFNPLGVMSGEVFYINGARKVTLDMELDCDTRILDTIIRFDGALNPNLTIKISNIYKGVVFSSDSTRLNAKLDFGILKTSYQPDVIFFNIIGFCATGYYNTPGILMFSNCSNFAFNGYIDQVCYRWAG